MQPKHGNGLHSKREVAMRSDRNAHRDLEQQSRSSPEIERRGATITVLDDSISPTDLAVNSLRREQP
jgi:hypothetical protein